MHVIAAWPVCFQQKPSWCRNEQVCQRDGKYKSPLSSSMNWIPRYVKTYTFLLQLDMVVSPCPEAETLQMRQWVISSILDSERDYVDVLNTLQQVHTHSLPPSPPSLAPSLPPSPPLPLTLLPPSLPPLENEMPI